MTTFPSPQRAHHRLLRSRVIQTAVLLSIILAARADDDRAPYDDATFFNPVRLVDVRITLSEEDWDTLRHQRRSFIETIRTDVPPSEQEKQFDYFPAHLTIDGTAVGTVAIRKKGFIGSMDNERPSLKIQIDRFHEDKAFAGVDTLTLNNNRQDRDGVYQTIGYQLFREAGLPASRCNLAVVTVNGRSLGIYSNVESLDKRHARHHFGNADGTLYEGTTADFQSGNVIRFERKFGSKKNDRRLDHVLEAIETPDDEIALERISGLVDLDEFYRFWALECLVGHWDGYVSNKNNYFVYYNPDRRRFQFTPWGMDQLGRDTNPFWGGDFTPPKSVKADAALPRRLYSIPAARDRYFEALHELLETVWKEDTILERIQELETLMAPHRVREPSTSRNQRPDFAAFVRNRRAEIESELENGHPDWSLPTRDPIPEMAKTGRISAEINLTSAPAGDTPGSFTPTSGNATVSLVRHDREIRLESSELTLGKTSGRRGESFWLQVAFPEPWKDDDAPAIGALEIRVPTNVAEAVRPLHVDVFAAPVRARILPRTGWVPRDEGSAAIGGRLTVQPFGTEPAPGLKLTLKGSLFEVETTTTD